MIKRYSSSSNVFSLRTFGKDTIVSWQEFHNFLGYNKMAVIGLNLFPAPKLQSSSVSVSSNLVPSTLSNPNGTILSWVPGKVTKIFIKGQFHVTHQYIRVKIWLRISFTRSRDNRYGEILLQKPGSRHRFRG